MSVFIFNGGEGSAWATPIACHVIAAYFGVGQYASLMGDLTPEEAAAQTPVCNSLIYNPTLPQFDFGTPSEAAPENTPGVIPLNGDGVPATVPTAAP